MIKLKYIIYCLDIPSHHKKNSKYDFNLQDQFSKYTYLLDHTYDVNYNVKLWVYSIHLLDPTITKEFIVIDRHHKIGQIWVLYKEQ